MKTCNVCREELPPSNFNKRSTTPDGLQYRCRDCMTKWRCANRSRIKDKNAEWYTKNKDSCRAVQDEYRKKNLYRWVEAKQRRRAVLLSASVGFVPSNPKQALIDLYGNSCMNPRCPTPDSPLTIDHVIPLTKGGSHGLDNFQLLCKSCNSAKGNYSSVDYRTGR